jgi:tripeptidyl-peptidase-1
MAFLLVVMSMTLAMGSELKWDTMPRVVVEPEIHTTQQNMLNWVRGERANSQEAIHVIIMLRHDSASLASFEAEFMDISTPGKATYGQFLSRVEVDARLPPKWGAKDTVLAFLHANGVTKVSAEADMIEAEIKVDVAEEIFKTKLHVFKHASHGIELIRAVTAYTVPDVVANSIYLVGDLAQLPAIGGIRLAEPNMKEINSEWPSDCDGCHGMVTPGVLQQTYKLGQILAAQNTSMAVAEFQGVSWDKSDLDHFQKTCHLNNTVAIDRQIGRNLPICKIPLLGAELCMEALLDIEYIKAVAGDIPLTGISAVKYSLLNWAKQLASMDDAPLVHSVSYGNDEVQQSSKQFMEAVNAQFMKLGARGLSILFASGDQGVYGRTGPTPDGRFHPDFPASSPYVTAVGGTDFAQKGVIGEEKAWSSGGGGFSDTFPAPAYQESSVAHYFSTASAKGVLPSSSNYNRTGRGYPDLAALGGQQNPYCVSASLFVVSSMTGVAGTSASCPVVAGMIARLNALRSSNKMPPMGFLNPFIYQNGAAFNDVTLGDNHDSGKEGFQAMPGWDPATGFGTPDFEKLQAAALSAFELQKALVV